MKTIVCFGDSNTWGYIPGSAGRYPFSKRWTSVLQDTLGDQFQVVAEGLCGRYTVHDESFRLGRNGAALIQPILESHAPVHLLILFLGTNDVLHFRDLTAYDAMRGMEVLIKMARSSETGAENSAPEIMVVAPPKIRKLSAELDLMCRGNPANSDDFAKYYRALAEQYGLLLLDAAQITEPSHIDGVHLDEQGHLLLGKAIARTVLESG